MLDLSFFFLLFFSILLMRENEDEYYADCAAKESCDLRIYSFTCHFEYINEAYYNIY
jgi:hypothetical protein